MARLHVSARYPLSLARVKSHWDPENLFKLNQNIYLRDTLCVLGANLPGVASSFRSLLWRVLRLRGARPDCALGSGSLRSVQHQPLVAWGSHDAFGNADAARRFADAAGAELAFVGRGHLPWLDEPAQTATLVQAHLDRIVARH
jgi:pimeloyl-ACP methyl ester carboxylesterase